MSRPQNHLNLTPTLKGSERDIYFSEIVVKSVIKVRIVRAEVDKWNVKDGIEDNSEYPP